MKSLASIRRRRSERGAAQIEFALTLMLVMLLIFFIWEMCMIVYAYTALSGAANEGLRYAMVHGTPAGCATDTATLIADTKTHVVDYAKFSLQKITADNVTVTFPDGSCAAPNRVTISISYTYVPFTRFFTTVPTLRAYAEGRVVF